MLEKVMEFKKRISGDPLARGIVIIASGSVVAQVIGIITMPLITRLYTPSDFGILGIFTATLALLAFAGGFRYDLALPLPGDDRDAANLFIFFLMLLSTTTIGFLIVIFLFGDTILSLFQLAPLKPYLLLLAFGFFSISLYGALTSWVTRNREYTRITYTKISQSVGGAAGKIALGFLSAGPIGLLVGYILSQVLGIGTLLRYMWGNDRQMFAGISWDRMTDNAKRYIRFPLFSFPSGIINTLALQLPVFMLSSIYGLSVVGMYSLASSLLVVSSSLISASMGQVYFAEVASMMRENSREMKNLYISTTKKLFIIGIPLIMIPCLLAPVLFPLIFGEVWKDAGLYCLPLSIMALSGFAISPTSMLSGYGFNHWQLSWDIARTSLIFLGFIAVQIFSLPVLSALLVYSSLMAIMYGISYAMNIHALNLYLRANP
jgi:O-antigen/teichoic acid export membrane protein